MAEDLKPCPFCGGEARRVGAKEKNQVVIACVATPLSCSVRMSGKYSGILTEAQLYDALVERWNTRAPLPLPTLEDTPQGALYAGISGSIHVLVDRTIPPGEVQLRDADGRVLVRMTDFLMGP